MDETPMETSGVHVDGDNKQRSNATAISDDVQMKDVAESKDNGCDNGAITPGDSSATICCSGALVNTGPTTTNNSAREGTTVSDATDRKCVESAQTVGCSVTTVGTGTSSTASGVTTTVSGTTGYGATNILPTQGVMDPSTANTTVSSVSGGTSSSAIRYGVDETGIGTSTSGHLGTGISSVTSTNTGTKSVIGSSTSAVTGTGSLTAANSGAVAGSKTVSRTQPAPTSTGTTIAAFSGGKRKKTLMRDENAPKAPLSGYLIFLNKNRENVRLKHPDLPFQELTKILGTMWSELPLDKKQVYLDQAEKDKKQYIIELDRYQKSDAYRAFIAERDRRIKVLKQEAKTSPGRSLICLPCNKWFENSHNLNEHLKSRKHKKILEVETRGGKSKQSTMTAKQVLPAESVGQTKTPTQRIPPTTSNLSSAQANNFPDMSAVAESDLDIPVFSDSFLHYNKSRESELRKLRRATVEFEEQNAILSKHIDSLKSAIGKLEEEKTNSEQDIKRLEPFLKNFCEIVVRKFSDLRLPNSHVVPTESSIGEFLVELCDVCEQSSDSALAQKVKQVLRGFDYPNCLS